MKHDLIDVSETQKNLVIEIPADTVDTAVSRVTRDYSHTVRVPGFRQGKVPPKVVWQRFREQILHEVVHDLIPRAVDEALRVRALDPIDTPDIRDVVIEEGQPLKFTASFETVPPIDPGDYTSLSLRRRVATVEPDAVEKAIERLRDRAGRYEPVEGRGIETGDSPTIDLERRPIGADGAPEAKSERHENVTIEIGAPSNPPGFDVELSGLTAGASKHFRLSYPADYAIKELAGTEVEYLATVKSIRARVRPALDDEFARDLGEFDSLEALRARVSADLQAEAERDAERELRADLLRSLATRVTFDAPASLVDREIDRRVEEFARQLIQQRLDPAEMKIDWEEFRQHQREPASAAVKSALVLDEVARRERVAVTDEEVEAEVGRYAERTARTPAAVRARVEKEGGMARLYAGLRREKTIDLLLGRATIVTA